MKFTDKGVPVLRDNEIEEIAYRLLRKAAPDCVDMPEMTPIPSIIKWLQDNHGLGFSLADDLGFMNGRKIRGKTILSQGVILLDSSIVTNDESLYFMTAAHEIGHWTLHRSRKIKRDDSEEEIDCFEDEDFSFWDKNEINTISRKKELRTSLDFLEHHAKVFAANLLMPRNAFITAVQAIQLHLGISRNIGQVYLYDDPIQNGDYRRVVTLLHELFKAPKQAISIRFKELGLLNDLRGVRTKQSRESIRDESLRRAREK